MSHENEFKKYIRSRNDTKFFIIVNPYGPKYVEQFHDEKYSIYALKTPSVTIDFIKNIISFSEELDSVYQYKELIIDYREKTVMVNNKTLVLTPMEFDLLVYLKIHASTTLSREDLIRAVWGYSFLGDSRTIDTHIKSLRRKLGPYRCIVKTVWGKGYKYSEC
jgi:DNA-binding response OmpR family regulator